jgi:hypothetical protein
MVEEGSILNLTPEACPSRFTPARLPRVLGTPELKITMEVVCEMSLYRSLSHYLARKLSPGRLAQLTPPQRKARKLAQQRLSEARLRPTKTFGIPAAHEPPRAAHRDWLALDDPKRDVLRP